MHRPWALLLLTLALALPAGAAEIYRWTDEQGQTHYSATPPRGVDAELVNVRAGRTPPGDSRAAGGAAAAADPEATPQAPARPQRDVAFERRQCETARQNLEVMRSGGTNRRFRDPEGNIVRYTEEQLAREIARLESLAAQYCQG